MKQLKLFAATALVTLSVISSVNASDSTENTDDKLHSNKKTKISKQTKKPEASSNLNIELEGSSEFEFGFYLKEEYVHPNHKKEREDLLATHAEQDTKLIEEETKYTVLENVLYQLEDEIEKLEFIGMGV